MTSPAYRHYTDIIPMHKALAMSEQFNQHPPQYYGTHIIIDGAPHLAAVAIGSATSIGTEPSTTTACVICEHVDIIPSIDSIAEHYSLPKSVVAGFCALTFNSSYTTYTFSTTSTLDMLFTDTPAHRRDRHRSAATRAAPQNDCDPLAPADRTPSMFADFEQQPPPSHTE